MKKSKNEGWYTFADGYRCWFVGMGASDRKREEYKHGKIIKFDRT